MVSLAWLLSPRRFSLHQLKCDTAICLFTVLLLSVVVVCCCLVAKSCLTLCDPMDCSPPGPMGFSRPEYWSGLPFPSPGDLPKPGIEPMSPAWQEDSLSLNYLGSPLLLSAAAAKSLQSCPTLCDPMDCSLPGSSVHGIFQARVLEWGAIAFSLVTF